MVFPSWKCCAKILELHSFEKFVWMSREWKLNENSWSLPLPTPKKLIHISRQTEDNKESEKKSPKSCLLCAENVDWNIKLLSERNKYLKHFFSSLLWGDDEQHEITLLLFGFFSLSGIRNILLPPLSNRAAREFQGYVFRYSQHPIQTASVAGDAAVVGGPRVAWCSWKI